MRTIYQHVDVTWAPVHDRRASVVHASYGSGPGPYVCMDMPHYIHDNTEDEISHHTFLNADLASKDADPVNLDRFRTLRGSTATGAQHIGRLTNLLELTVDTSRWTRYRSRTQNPDLGAFPPAIPDLTKGRFPAIPRSDGDVSGSTAASPSKHLQALANGAIGCGKRTTKRMRRSAKEDAEATPFSRGA